jgi:hypothetical protein
VPPRHSMTSWGRILLLVMAVVAAAVSSCSGNKRKPVFPVRGQVLINGKPAAGATVFFYPVESDPEALAPYGVTDAKGSFTLTTYLTYDGAPAGEYVVTIRCPGPPKRGDEEQGPDRLKGRYGDPKTSTLRAKVEKKPNELQPFELTGK